MKKLVTLTLTGALALFAAPPAAAMHMEVGAPAPGAKAVFVAYGVGVTACDITVMKQTGYLTLVGPKRYGTRMSGVTSCNAPVEQTGQATVPANFTTGVLDGGLCSGVRTSCTSGGTWWNVLNYQPMTYRMTLRAPMGQGWVGAPTNCTGVGTDILRCAFSINDVDPQLA